MFQWSAWATGMAFIDKYNIWDKAWTCWVPVNQYLNSLWDSTRFTETVDERIRKSNSSTPVEWAVAIIKYPEWANVSADAKKYWHVAIVTKVNSDWTVDLWESNFNSDWKVGVRKGVNPATVHIKGYYVPQWAWWAIKYSDLRKANFEKYASDPKTALWATKEERQASLQEMWYNNFAEFNKDFVKWWASQVQEQADPIFIAAVKDITENALFDYVDKDWKSHEWLFWKQWQIDANMIAKIENNIAKWEKRSKWVILPQIFSAGKIARLWQWIESLQTIRSSKVIDIIKTWKVKLYPMSDSDVNLLATAWWINLNAFANPTKASELNKTLRNLILWISWWGTSSEDIKIPRWDGWHYWWWNTYNDYVSSLYWIQ